MRFFQILYRCADGGQSLTGSIGMRDVPGLVPEDCLRFTTDFVRANLLSIWEVAA